MKAPTSATQTRRTRLRILISFRADFSGRARDRPIEAPAFVHLFGDRPGIAATPGGTLSRADLSPNRNSGKTLEPRYKGCATIRDVRKRVLIVDDHEPFRAVA